MGLASRNEVSFHPTLAKIALIGSLSCLMIFFVSPNLTACQLYGVHDQGLNNTQFFTVSPETFEVKALGEMKKAHDIEALDIHPQTAELFAASGKDTKKPGYLYRVDKNTGQLIDIGSTGFKEIDGLSFHPDGTLWGWASGDGLVTIDSTTGKTNLVATHSGEVEDLTWNTAGTMLFGVENVRNNPDAGVKLLAYDGNTVTTVCEELTQSLEIEALDTLPDDTLIFGLHGKNGLPLGVIDVDTCQMTAETEIATDYNDVEGIAWPTKACATQKRAQSCQEIKVNKPSSEDGVYQIDPDGEGDNQPFEVYCHNMNTEEPKEYLELKQTGENYNYSLYKSGGARTGEDVITHYSKIRINPKTLIVDIGDKTFSSSTGQLYYRGNPTESSGGYGIAWDCITYYSSEGKANIDLTGTQFKIDDNIIFDPTIPGHSWKGNGTSLFEQNRQVVNTTGGGYCGGNIPKYTNDVNEIILKLDFISH